MNEAINFRAKKLNLYDAIWIWICGNLYTSPESDGDNEMKSGEERQGVLHAKKHNENGMTEQSVCLIKVNCESISF